MSADAPAPDLAPAPAPAPAESIPTSETATSAPPVVHDADAQAAHEDTATTPRAARLVPVTEAIRYRKRAQIAEQETAAMQQRLQALEAQLNETRQSLERAERRRSIDQLLAESDAIDLDAARLLTEAAVAGMSAPDAKLAVEDLRRHKPWLFRQRPSAAAGAMPARSSASSSTPAQRAAISAAATGDRNALLRYLRLRRKP